MAAAGAAAAADHAAAADENIIFPKTYVSREYNYSYTILCIQLAKGSKDSMQDILK